MNILKSLVLDKIGKGGNAKAVDIAKASGFSRAYVSRILAEMCTEGTIARVGKSHQTKYVLATNEAFALAKKEIYSFVGGFVRVGLHEDFVFSQIQKETGILDGIRENVLNILRWSVTEMINNAIEHSESDKVLVKMKRDGNVISFSITDYGIGIFNKLKMVFGFSDEISAVQHLLKGKQTTDEKHHSGLGIFFTSKMLNRMSIESGEKEIIFDNNIGDVFVKMISPRVGTVISGAVKLDTNVSPKKVFDEFTNQETFEFTKTKVLVKMYKLGRNLISRSEAKRMLFGLDKFETIVLDFKDVETVGQGFADEVFRVWQNLHSNIQIEYENANEIVSAMIGLAKK